MRLRVLHHSKVEKECDNETLQIINLIKIASKVLLAMSRLKSTDFSPSVWRKSKLKSIQVLHEVIMNKFKGHGKDKYFDLMKKLLEEEGKKE